MRTCKLLAFYALIHTYKEQARPDSSVGCVFRLAEVINAFPACFTTQAKENTRLNAAENTLLHYFHQATCPIKHMV